MEKKIEILTDNQRIRPKNSEVERLLSDNSKAKHLLDWEPKYEGLSGFRRGLSNTIEWFTDVTNFSTYKSEQYDI